MSYFEEAYQRTTNTLARLQNGARAQAQQERRVQATQPQQSVNMKAIERERMYRCGSDARRKFSINQHNREQHGLNIQPQRFYPTAESLSTRHRTLRTSRGYDAMDGYHSDVPMRPNSLSMRPASATPLNNDAHKISPPTASTLDRKPMVNEFQSIQ